MTSNGGGFQLSSRMHDDLRSHIEVLVDYTKDFKILTDCKWVIARGMINGVPCRHLLEDAGD